VMNVTYAQVLSALADQIAAAPDVPEEQKKTWTTTLRKISEHPLAVAAVTLVADRLTKG
jgi:hypothetical protein